MYFPLQGFGGGSGYCVTGGGNIGLSGWGAERGSSRSPVMGSRERDRGRADGGVMHGELQDISLQGS